jgi:hypothetical protein
MTLLEAHVVWFPLAEKHVRSDLDDKHKHRQNKLQDRISRKLSSLLNCETKPELLSRRADSQQKMSSPCGSQNSATKSRLKESDRDAKSELWLENRNR